MMDDILSLQRRVFLQQAAGAVALASVSHRAETAVPVRPTLVICQESDHASCEFARMMQHKGMRVFPLGDDPVRAWRDQLGTLVVDEGYRLMGRTSYATWFMLRGLAAEHRIFPQHEYQPVSGSFDWSI